MLEQNIFASLRQRRIKIKARERDREREVASGIFMQLAFMCTAGLAKFHIFSSIFFVRVHIITPIRRGGRIVVSGLQTSKHDTKT